MSNWRKRVRAEGRAAWGLGVSTAALMTALAVPTAALAQETPAAEEATDPDTVVVTGFRESLQSAQQRKRTSDTIVDSVTAEDIGALPDRSVTETLQRIPGISINRFAAGVDPDHFSVEGSGVVVRGLTYVRSEFNGREAFTANNGRALSFADVPSELLGGVDVFKSPSADRIEGGIAGVVNLRTRLPFDKKGFVMAGSLELNYSDFVEKASPTAALVVSNTWDTGIGEIGLLGSVSYSQLFSRADRFQVSSFRVRPIYSDGTRTDVIPFGTATQRGSGLFPRGAVMGTQEFERRRFGYAAAAQWRSNDRRAEATFQFLRSDARQAWTEHTIEIATDNVASNGDSRARDGTSIVFDSSGLFESGVITGPTGWRADQNTAGDIRTPALGLQSNNIRRDHDERAVTDDYSFNFRYQVADNLSVSFDYQHVDSFVDIIDNGLWLSSYQDAAIRLNGSNFPTVEFRAPQNCPSLPCTGAPGSSANYPSYYTGTHQTFADPYNSFYRSAMDHIEASDGNSDSFRLDAELSFPDGSFFESVRVGGRYADRDQTARFSTYNWGRLSEQWGNGGPIWADDPVDNVTGGTGGAPLQGLQPFCFDNFFGGSVNNPLGGQCRPFYAANTTTPSGYLAYIDYANRINREWEPTVAGAGGRQINGGWRSLADRPNAIAGTPFTPGEINPQQEINKAAYVMLRFGSEFGNGMKLSGNAGVRYTTTNRKSEGFIEFPFATNLPTTDTCRDSINNALTGAGGSVNTLCALTPTQLTQIGAYLNGAIVPNNFDLDYEYWLPSLNLKLEVGGGLQFRAAYSKGVSPPSLGLVRNYFPVGVTAVPRVDASGNQIPVVVTPTAPGTGAFGSDGNIAPGQVLIQGSFNAGNPELLPTEADSFDITAEWYFSRVGQLTASLFYKELRNVLTNDTVRRTFSNNGQTFEAVVTTPVNSQAVGKIKGFEIAYQQVFDFLPGPLKGLGLQANYTYVASEGVPQSTLSETDPDVAAGRQPTITGANFPLQGLSEHQFNITPFIDIGPVSARASYSWRSQYLLTLRDVITPFDPIFQEDYGQLDASITISITDQLKLGIQGVNLTNSVTKTSAAVTDQNGDVRLVPRGWYVNDRRITGMIRFSF
ncbi:TonB-dependent receptor [Sphingomonas sp.]|uniref:TonB-dependent receptor n=1 Tax=Sphingomonas sp. TaxID=28214 RepID=UPI0017B57B1C|nr:TonB-dependent receptor [Sphingomonas sp.]MBA4760175.1 TonB-dependent receptor [Sphingomonas sp.]